MVRHRVANTAVLGVLLSLSTSASAQAPGRIAVVVDTVDVSESVAAAVRVAAELAIREMEIEIVEAGDPRSGGIDVSELGACVTKGASCVRDVLAKLEADRVLYFALNTAVTAEVGDGSEGPPDLSVTARVFDAGSGELLAIDQRLCAERCQEHSEFSAIIREMTSTLATADAPADDPKPLETAPAVEAVATPMSVSERPRSEPGRPLRWLPYASVAVGAAALAGGVTLIAIDGPRIEGRERLPDERATRTPGLITAGLGVALIGAGVALWLMDSDARAGVNGSATVVPGGASVTITGRF